MINIAKQILKYCLINNKKPSKEDIQIDDFDFFEKKGTLFVTLYKNGEIIGSSGNIIEIESNILSEMIENIYNALNDNRFEKISPSDLDKINIRIDNIKSRIQLKDIKIKDLNPIKSGVVVIKNDHSKMAVILPNISSKISSGNDFLDALGFKLKENFVEQDYIVFSIETEILTNY